MKKGISLIEVLVASALVSIVLLLISLALVNGLQNTNFSFSHSQLSNNVSQAINKISGNVLLASSLPGSFSYSGQTYLSSATVLILELPAVSSKGLALSGSSDSVVYSLDSPTGGLKELIVPSINSARDFRQGEILNDVSSLSFITADSSKGKMVTVSISAFQNVNHKTISFSLSKTARPRNQQ